MAEIQLDGVTRRFAGTLAPAVDEMTLTVVDGELMALLGPPGSGKTTVLRLVAGLETPDGGRVRIGDHDSPGGPLDVALVFQNYALYPNLTIAENIGYPLRMADLSPAEIADRVAEVVAHLGLEDLVDRAPDSLSSGDRMRVALARSLVRLPHVLLMDEPLAPLEPSVRAEVRDRLVAAQRALRITTLYATPDPEEAAYVGDRIAFLQGGRLTGLTAD